MKILMLFLIFLKIGTFSFGGGYGMIPMVKEECIVNGWLTEEEVLDFIGLSEATPGPIAVNMATFIGYSQGGVLGSFLATLGVILPAFLIILLIVCLLHKLLEYKYVNIFLNSLKPAIVGLIITTAILTFLSVVFGIKNLNSEFSFDYKNLIIFIIVCVLGFGYKLIRKKTFNPILMIIIGAILGILFNF